MRLAHGLLALALSAVAACQPVTAKPIVAEESESKVVRRSTAVSIKGTVRGPAGFAARDDDALFPGTTKTWRIAMAPTGLGRTLLATDAPIASTTVFLATADGTPVKPAVRSKTDDDGRFTFEKVPAGHYLVSVLAAAAADGKPVRLTTLAQATADLASVRITLGSTLVAGVAMKGKAAIGGFDQGTYDRVVYDVDRAYKDEPAPNLESLEAIEKALASVVAQVTGLTKLAADLDFAIPAAVNSAVPTPAATATESPG